MDSRLNRALPATFCECGYVKICPWKFEGSVDVQLSTYFLGKNADIEQDINSYLVNPVPSVEFNLVV